MCHVLVLRHTALDHPAAIRFPNQNGAAREGRRLKHGRHFRKLGKDASHRWAMIRTMVTQLIEHERIQTTVAKAKELRRVADRVVTFAKEGSLRARRKAAAVVRTDAAVNKLFTELAERYKERPGGFTRVLQIGLNRTCHRMRASEHAPRGRHHILERRHGLAQIVERGGAVLVERLRVSPPHPEHDLTTISENASPPPFYCFAQQCPGFFEAF